MKVYIEKISSPAELRSRLFAALDWLGWETIARSDARLFLKPNLTWREPLPGVTTTPEFIEAVVSVLRERCQRIAVGEADGGYHSYKAEEAFQSHGLFDLAKKYDIEVVNLSKEPVVVRTTIVGGQSVAVELPERLLAGTDVFVTLPVPKVHAMTTVSLGFKNQWGCQPGTMRLRNHPEFTKKIIAINQLLKPCFALYDGTYFLDKTGPMIGEPVCLNLLVAADDVGAGDFVCCDIMGFDPSRIGYLRYAQKLGMMPKSLETVTLNQDVARFRTHHFRLQRTLLNWVTLGAFHSRLGTRLFYDSPFARPFHTLLYTIRRNPLIGRLLYGSVGPPKVEGHRD